VLNMSGILLDAAGRSVTHGQKHAVTCRLRHENVQFVEPDIGLLMWVPIQGKIW